MKIWFPAAAALLALGFSATASAAPVSYQCQGNKKVTVNYSFNKQGIPTSATATLKGKALVMKYDLNSSDNVETYFKGAGYEISTSSMDSSNYREQPIMIFAPGSQILFKDCSPTAGAEASSDKPVNANKVTKSGTVSYMCEADRQLRVTYGFNGAGVPVKADATLKGKKVTMKYDLASSDNVDVTFKGAGYSLSTSDMNADNFRDQPVMVTGPGNQIAYKDCSPTE